MGWRPHERVCCVLKERASAARSGESAAKERVGCARRRGFSKNLAIAISVS